MHRHKHKLHLFVNVGEMMGIEKEVQELVVKRVK